MIEIHPTRKLWSTSVLCWMCLIFLVSACQTPGYLSEEELLAYVQEEDHGLLKKKNAPPLELSLQYRPNDLLILQDVGRSRDSIEVTEARAKYQDYAYFILSIKAGEKNALYSTSQDMGTFSEMLQTLSFRMADKVSLITSLQDTIQVADYIFDRTYGMGSTNLMFVFSNKKINESEWFTFNLKEFGMRTGDQRFGFQTQDIRDTPQLIDFANTAGGLKPVAKAKIE